MFYTIYRYGIIVLFLLCSNLYADVMINNNLFNADDDGLLYYTSQAKDQVIKPFKLVYIASEDDFPDPVGGTITLEDKTTYFFTQNVSTAYEFNVDGISVEFDSLSTASLTYTDSNTLFTGSPVTFEWNLMPLIGTVNGTAFDIDYTNPTGLERFLIRHADIINFGSMGSVDDVVVSLNDISLINIGQGFSFTDNVAVGFLNVLAQSWRNQSDCVFYTFDGTIPAIILTNLISIPQSNESIFDFKSDLITSGRVTNAVLTTVAGGSVFALGSQSKENIQFSFLGANEVSDSTVRARLKVEDNVSATTISTIDTPTKINATFIDGDLEERMVFQIDCTFDGSTDVITSGIIHGMSTDDEITFKLENSGTLPTGLSEGTIYYIIEDTGTTFQVAATAGGAAIDFTGNGTADQYYRSVTGNNDGIVVYTGLENISILATGWVSMKNATATAVDMRVVIMGRDTDGTISRCCNGSVISPTSQRTISSSINNIIDLTTDQGITIYVENLEGTSNITVTDLLVSFTKI